MNTQNQQPEPLEDIFAEPDEQSSAPPKEPVVENTMAPAEPAVLDEPMSQPSMILPESEAVTMPPQEASSLPVEEPAAQEAAPQVSAKKAPFRFRLPRFGRGSRLLLIALAGIVLLVGIGFGVAVLLRSADTPTAEDEVFNELNDVTPATGVQANEEAAARDSDGDGLIDTEEESLRTDPNAIDTDGDLLTDRQEVRIYQTDPRSPDTDNDGFSDGEEVRNFYNPKGSGKMIDVVEAIDDFNTENQ